MNNISNKNNQIYLLNELAIKLRKKIINKIRIKKLNKIDAKYK